MSLVTRHLSLASKLAATAAVLALWLAPAARAADAPVTVALDTAHPGAPVAPEFSGLSYEVSSLLPGPNGLHYFRAGNAPLVALFRTLGIKSLRIGGNTSDRDVRELPAEADLDELFGFAKAAGVKVIYCLRLRNGDPAVDAATAKYIMDRYAPLMDSFSIGQEPSAYPVEKVDTRPVGERMGGAVEKYPYTSYREQWKKFADVIVAAVPNIKFCGPSVHNNGDWARRFIADFGSGNHVALVTEHLYAGGAAAKLPSPEVGRDRMLTEVFTHAYEKLHDSFVPQAEAAGLPYRLEEVNSYFNGGALGSSNTFAAALWSVDFMYWWAKHGASGLDFHTGDRVSMNGDVQAPRYAAFTSSAGGFDIRPLAYGLKAFDLGAHGRLVPVTIGNAENVNVTAYAAADARTVFVTIVNKEHGPGARAAAVTLPGKWAHAQTVALQAPEGNEAATTDLTLGGAPIGKDGQWSGTWHDLASPAAGDLHLTIPATSAVVLRLSE